MKRVDTCAAEFEVGSVRPWAGKSVPLCQPLVGRPERKDQAHQMLTGQEDHPSNDCPLPCPIPHRRAPPTCTLRMTASASASLTTTPRWVQTQREGRVLGAQQNRHCRGSMHAAVLIVEARQPKSCLLTHPPALAVHPDIPHQPSPSPCALQVLILGGGPNRIGQGIEFDYCCCHASFSLRDAGYETIMMNSNPETVSTDYDTSSRLYFEPLTVSAGRWGVGIW